MKRMTKHDVAELVRRHIANRPLNGFTLEVVDSAIWKERSSWRVPIRTNKEPRHISRFYMDLAKLETEIEDKEDIDVNFTPAGESWSE